MKRDTGQRPTLGGLTAHDAVAVAVAALRSVPALLACAVPVIRSGVNTSSDKLRQCALCTTCGRKGATLQHPGWAGAEVGFLPFPVYRVTA